MSDQLWTYGSNIRQPMPYVNGLPYVNKLVDNGCLKTSDIHKQNRINKFLSQHRVKFKWKIKVRTTKGCKIMRQVEVGKKKVWKKNSEVFYKQLSKQIWCTYIQKLWDTLCWEYITFYLNIDFINLQIQISIIMLVALDQANTLVTWKRTKIFRYVSLKKTLDK